MPDLDDKSISDLTAVSDTLLGEDTLVEVSAENAGTPSSFKATLGAIFDKILRSVSFTQRLNTTNKTVFGAINELAQGGSSNVPTPTAANKTIKSQSDGEGGYEWTETDYYPYIEWTTLRFIDGREANIAFSSLVALSTKANNPVWGWVMLSDDNYQTVSDIIPVVLTGSFNQTYSGYTDHTVYFVGAKDGKLYTVYLTDSTSHPNLKCDVEVEITDIGGGSSTLGGLSDVNVTSPQGGQSLIYDVAYNVWKNGLPAVRQDFTIQGDVGDSGCYLLGDIDEWLTVNATSKEMLLLGSDTDGNSYSFAWFGNYEDLADTTMNYMMFGRIYINVAGQTVVQTAKVTDSALYPNTRMDIEWAEHIVPMTDAVELTKAEYDNLSEAEKMNGTLYFITDGQSGGGGGASEAEYSTVEHEVGTWIDGSTLYERTFVCRANNTDLITFTGTIREGGTYDLGLTNVANVQLFGMNTTRADSGQTQYTDIAPLSTEVFVSFRNTDGALYFKAVHGAVDLTVTLRYTKTSS